MVVVLLISGKFSLTFLKLVAELFNSFLLLILFAFENLMIELLCDDLFLFCQVDLCKTVLEGMVDPSQILNKVLVVEGGCAKTAEKHCLADWHYMRFSFV